MKQQEKSDREQKAEGLRVEKKMEKKGQLKGKEGMEKGNWEGLAGAGMGQGTPKTIRESSAAKLNGLKKQKKSFQR